MGLKSVLKKSKCIRALHSKWVKSVYCMATIISPKLNTKMHYKAIFKKPLDLENPQTLNEKVLWLKLNRYNKNPLVIKCADKYAVREYIKERGCEEILNDLINVYDSPEEIDWDALPDKFVLKWNFGAGMNIVCDDKSKLDKKATIKQLKKWGKCKYWLPHSEMQYKYAPKKIVCEKYLNDGNGKLPCDYKLYCFNGTAKYVFLCMERETGHTKFYFFDRDWNLCRLNKDSMNAPADFKVEKPPFVDKLFEYAEKLSEPFPFVRTDFYIVGDKIYFGELTFTPSGGLDAKRPEETDLMFGKMLDIRK